MIYMRKLLLTIFLCLSGSFVLGASFTSKDTSFSIPLPNKWQWETTKANEVLKVKNKNRQITVYALKQCNTLDCLESSVKEKIKQLKKQKVQIIKNTYSGEEIKKTEFSTLDPILYYSYNKEGSQYTEGYFLADSKGYKIEISGLTYLEAERNIIPIIEPKPKAIQDLPLITEEIPFIEENIDAPEISETERQTLSETLSNKNNSNQETNRNIESSKKVSIILLLIILYVLTAFAFFAYNLCFYQMTDQKPTNPKSFYPIRGARMYGSPDLFFKVYDSQGHNFIVTSQRWSSFLKEYGFYGALFFFLLHFIVSSLVNKGFTSDTILTNTVLSACYLFVGLGLIFTLAGYILDIIFPAPIFIYTEKGTILFKIIRRSNGLFGYVYLALTNAYTVVFRLETPKLFLTRKWVLYDKNGELAVIKEKSFLRSFARKLFGHLGGTLRAEYIVEGKNESKGQITSLRTVKTNFQIDIDKPQAFPPSAMLTAAAVIFTKGRDKFYPWFD